MSNEQRLPHDGANYRLDEAVVSERDGVLRADDYDDVYFAGITFQKQLILFSFT